MNLPLTPDTDTDTDADGDPRPQPPTAPDIDACCGNGCNPCIFELHDLAMDEYRQALRAWVARHPQPGDPAQTSSGKS